MVCSSSVRFCWVSFATIITREEIGIMNELVAACKYSKACRYVEGSILKWIGGSFCG